MADVPFDVHIREIGIRERKIGELETKLETLQKKELWFHTQLKFRRTIEKVELLVRPTNINREDWTNVTRVEKWRSYFNGEEDYGFIQFFNCVRGVSNDANILAKHINQMYGVLNAHIHLYIHTREISNIPFREDALNAIALCLDRVDV